MPVQKMLVPCYAVISSDGLIRLRIHPEWKAEVQKFTDHFGGVNVEVEIEYDETVDLDSMIVGKQPAEAAK